MNGNGNEKIFVIGDIHGCLDMLKRLLEKIPWNPSRDRLIFLGDYIDRGEDSKGVIDFLIDLTKASPHVECLMGNHESLFLDYIEGGEDEVTFLFNGRMSTLNSYRKNGEMDIPEDHLAFIKSLKIMIELDEYYIVHAGLKPGIALEKQSTRDRLWIREDFVFSDYNFGKKIIFGHTPFTLPFVMHNKIGLDTGAVFGNKLSCVELPDMKFHSVEA
jgi:serine/threonine protein phosphatase 1